MLLSCEGRSAVRLCSRTPLIGRWLVGVGDVCACVVRASISVVGVRRVNRVTYGG